MMIRQTTFSVPAELANGSNLTSVTDSQPPVLHFRGKIIGVHVKKLKEEMNQLTNRHASGFILDLSQVPLLDSSALGVIMLTVQQLRQTGGKLVLLNPQPNVRNVLRVTRLDTVLEIVSDSESTRPPLKSNL